VLILIK